jgi:DNA invertase Pin-like site-specific DNA recombinase
VLLEVFIDWGGPAARMGWACVSSRVGQVAAPGHISFCSNAAYFKKLQAKRVDLVVTEQKIDTTTSTGRLMFSMLGGIAEFETDLRRERQLEGIAKAKAEGRFKGRPVTVDGEAIRKALAAGDKPAAVARQLNVARSTVYRVAAQT